MLKRFFRIKNYRNICCRPNDSSFKFFTNITYDFKNDNNKLINGKFDGIVNVIGPNNVGKSNLLSAIECLGGATNFSSSDRPDFGDNDEPIVLEYVLSGERGDTIYKKEFHTDDKTSTCFVFPDHSEADMQLVDTEYKDFRDQFIAFLTNHIKQPNVKTNDGLCGRINSVLNTLENNISLCKKIVDEVVDLYHELGSLTGQLYTEYSEEEVNAIFNSRLTLQENKNMIKSVYGIDIFPSIYKYSSNDIEKDVVNQMILTKDELLQDNVETKLIIKILMSLGYSIDTIKRLYADPKPNRTALHNTQREVNEKLKETSSNFTKMFPLKSDNRSSYNFELNFNTAEIELTIQKDDNFIDYERQSDGFRWYFAFYYNFLLNKPLPNGSFILLDEPCKTLHANGIKEFRKVIQGLAERFEWTFIIATHSPFLIDINHMEEVRILQDNNGSVGVYNWASCDKDGDHNYIKPISSALLTDSNTLYNNVSSKIVFVEGPSDYLYLTAFFQKFSKEKNFKGKHIIFFPIGGITGNSSKPRDDISEIEIISYLMVDGDETGEAFRQKYQEFDKVKIFSLKQISKDFETIESLFSKEDINKFGFEIPQPENNEKYYKNFNFASSIKRAILDSKTSKETNDRFKTVLKYIVKRNIKITAEVNPPF